MTDWFDTEEFWETFRPVLFDPSRWEDAAKEVDAILSIAPVPPGGRILDLCCGVGRHALELARRGYRATAVDRTERYLEEARQRAADEGLEIDFVREDMRRYRAPGRFDAAINMFTSFGYFEDPEDDLEVARNLQQSLKPGGYLVIDTNSREVLARIFRERDWHHLDEPEGAIMLEERKVRPGWGWFECTWTLLVGEKRSSFLFAFRPYSGTDLAALLRSAGFASIDLFGTLDGAPYDHAAKRLVAVARTATPEDPR